GGALELEIGVGGDLFLLALCPGLGVVLPGDQRSGGLVAGEVRLLAVLARLLLDLLAVEGGGVALLVVFAIDLILLAFGVGADGVGARLGLGSAVGIFAAAGVAVATAEREDG